MMRRFAAAVLAAVVNLMASMDTDALSIEDDDPSDDAMGDVDWQSSPHSNPRRAMPVAAGRSGPFAEPIDGAWAVRLPSGQAAAVGVKHRDNFVAEVGLRVVAGCPGWDELVARATQSARQRGALKLVVESEGVPAHHVREFVESRGFQFSRSRRLEWVDVSEFYTDLYWRGDGEDAAA